MTWTLGHYKAEYWPDETGTTLNGGGIDTGEALTGVIHEIFDPAISDYTGQPAHIIYRKVFITNEDDDTVTGASVFLSETKYAGMMTMAVEKVDGDSGSDPTTIPTGYSGEDFVNADGYSEALSKVVGGDDMDTGTSFGVWLRLEVPSGLQEADSNVPLNLVLVGTR
jgi:hypothetical protein